MMNLSRAARFCLLLFCFGVCSSLFAPAATAAANNTFDGADLFFNNFSTFGVESDEREIYELINKERSRKDLPELNWNSSLARLARAYSQKMADENFFSHFDRSGGSVDTRARAMRIKDWSKIGENLFFCEGYGNPNALAVRGWMRSPAHRQNILDREYTDTGIGIAESRDGKIYITQVFIER